MADPSENLAKNIPALAALYQKRNNLKNLITKMDGNDPLETLLTQIMKNNDNLQKLKKELENKMADKPAQSEPKTSKA